MVLGEVFNYFLPGKRVLLTPNAIYGKKRKKSVT
jgi:hypothetical protein